MAKVIASMYIETDYSKSRDEWIADEKAAIEKIRDYAKENGIGKTVGEEIKFPVADNYARYMVANENPLELIHLEIGDGYSIPEAHMRGLNLTDVRGEVERERSIRELFA